MTNPDEPTETADEDQRRNRHERRTADWLVRHGADDLQVLTRADVLKLIRVSSATLHRAVKAGLIPVVRLSPGRIGFLRRDIRDFLNTRRAGSLRELQ